MSPVLDANYEIKKNRSRRKSREQSQIGRDIGDIPPVKDPERKQRGIKSFQAFCDEYLPDRFPLPWSKAHRTAILKMELACKAGGLFALAMPRGSGKTTLVEALVIWAAITGQHSYVFLIGSTDDKAGEMLASIKTELTYNDLLHEDFPEVCYPIRKLEGITNRARGQLHHGNKTEIKWGADEIMLPSIPGSPASGTIIRTAGITGDIRGAVRTIVHDGKPRRIRPSFVALDDPQTDESAYSPAQCDKRHRIINGAILGMAGPGETMSAIMPCTVIREDDLADRILDPEKSPKWQGETTSMLISMPADIELWEKYRQLWQDSYRKHGDIREATAYYKKHRKAMDKGAEASWPERVESGDLSAIQSAMNIWCFDERAFWAEFQNKPMPEVEPDSAVMSAKEIMAKTNGHARYIVPQDATKLVGMIDVQGNALFYVIAAFDDEFTGYIVDYGVYPKQTAAHFTLSTLRKTLSNEFPKGGLEARIFAGLESLTDQLCGKEWDQSGGGVMRISKMIVDANWGDSTDTVYKFCQESDHAAVLIPSHGEGITAAKQPYSQYKKRKGEKLGHNWRIPNVSRKRTIKHLLYDTNYWKSFLHRRLRVMMGDPSCLSLFKTKRADGHRVIAEHFTAEIRTPTEGRGRQVDEWSLPNKNLDNHLFDCAVGCMVAGSMEGATMESLQSIKSKRRKRISLLELREAHG